MDERLSAIATHNRQLVPGCPDAGNTIDESGFNAVPSVDHSGARTPVSRTRRVELCRSGGGRGGDSGAVAAIPL
jgi:hypothetical protein